MENYEKTDIIKQTQTFAEDTVRCSGHGHLHGYVHYAKKILNEKRKVTVTGLGGAIGKAISTAELLKNDLELHQTNKIYYSPITEVWTPKSDQELQNIEVERNIPCISIVLQLDEPAIKKPGYQAPEVKKPPTKPIPRQPKFKKFSKKPMDKSDNAFINNQKHMETKFKVNERSNNGEGSRNNRNNNRNKKFKEKRKRNDSNDETNNDNDNVKENQANSNNAKDCEADSIKETGTVNNEGEVMNVDN